MNTELKLGVEKISIVLFDTLDYIVTYINLGI